MSPSVVPNRLSETLAAIMSLGSLRRRLVGPLTTVMAIKSLTSWIISTVTQFRR